MTLVRRRAPSGKTENVVHARKTRFTGFVILPFLEPPPKPDWARCFPPDSEPRGRPTAVPQSDGPPFLDPASLRLFDGQVTIVARTASYQSIRLQWPPARDFRRR